MDTFLFLLDGIDIDATVLHENDDLEESNHQSRLVVTLPGGAYIIEVTTVDPATEGQLTMTTTITGQGSPITVPEPTPLAVRAIRLPGSRRRHLMRP